jgi:DNA polymerase-3 subunit beta
MAFNCFVNKNELSNKLGELQNITNKRGTLAALNNVLLEVEDQGIVMTGTDLEVGLKLIVSAQVNETGTITIPSKKLFEIVRESAGESIHLEEKENHWITITAGKSTYNVAGIPSEEYPRFPDYDEDGLISFESHIFLDLVDKVIFSIAGEHENIYSLTSILFEKEKKENGSYLRMISSDGHRLSIMEKDVATDVDGLNLSEVTLIPKKGVQELRKFCENRDTIELAFEDKQLVVRDGEAVMVIRLRQGQFPHYQSILDSIATDNKLSIPRIPFLESLKRTDIFTEDVFHTIQLSIEAGSMVITSQHADIGSAKDELSIEYEGESMQLMFNCRYFIDALQVMESEVVKAYIDTQNSPCLLQGDDDPGFTSVIMPMQL